MKNKKKVRLKRKLRKNMVKVQRRKYKKYIFLKGMKYLSKNKKYFKGDIAKNQLKTAIKMFLNGMDRFSVITLAGAASNILSQLVKNEGDEPFIDYARKVYKNYSGIMPPRKKYNKHINEKLGINHIKHHSINDPEDIDIDENYCAEQAITKAVSDYIKLYGQNELFIKAFIKWAWVNNDR